MIPKRTRPTWRSCRHGWRRRRVGMAVAATQLSASKDCDGRARASVSASGEEKQSFTVDANLKFQNPFCLPSLQTAAARRLLHPATFPQFETAVSAQRQEIRVSLTTRNGGRVSSERVFNNRLCSFFIISIAERPTKGVGMGGYGFYSFLRRISLL